jgi:hypothetical protein
MFLTVRPLSEKYKVKQHIEIELLRGGEYVNQCTGKVKQIWSLPTLEEMPDIIAFMTSGMNKEMCIKELINLYPEHDGEWQLILVQKDFVKNEARYDQDGHAIQSAKFYVMKDEKHKCYREVFGAYLLGHPWAVCVAGPFDTNTQAYKAAVKLPAL